jgi:hypothetical protein
MEKKKTETVDYYYKVDPAYRVNAANSILTTITPDGQIKVDFVLESLTIPDRLTFMADSDKTKLSYPIDAEPKNQMQRLVQMGVLLTVDQADMIAGLIKQLVERMRSSPSPLKLT